jgi:hypothetical protein
MLGRWISVGAVALAGALPVSVMLSVALPAEAIAAPGPGYRVGTRLKAKRDCTIQGYAIKKGVVLTIASVRDDGKSVDLEFSGMTIREVSRSTIDSMFKRV